MQKGLCVVVLCSLACAAATAQENDPERPRIGLVLSGGGARGAAHVGVLRVLEELQVPVHCIAGTSAGALVGGMYAVGMSPDEIEALLAEMNWEDMLDDRPPRREMPFRRKQDDQRYLSRFEVGFNHGRFQLPPGLVVGQKLSFLLETVTLGAAGVHDFDQLPIPFRAVAADIRTGETVVLRDGDLSLAMRASMSLPGIFAPVEVDGRLLVDGGIVMNLPVSVIHEMEPDVIIAVDVGDLQVDDEKLRSLLGVFSQVVTVIVRNNVEEQASLASLVISPQLDDIKSMDFARSTAAIRVGEAAARTHSDQIVRWSIPAAEHASYLQRVRGGRRAEGVVTAVQVGISSTADPELIVDRIRTRPGDPLDVEAIRRDVQRLYELGDYERVSYRLLQEPDGYALLINADARSWGPHTMRFGINLVSDFEGSSAFNLLANYTMTALNSRRAEAKLALQLGNDPTLRGEFYQPLHRAGSFFVAARGEAANHVFSVRNEQGLLAEYRARELNLEADVGLQLGKYGELRTGVSLGNLELSARHGATPREHQDIDVAGYVLGAVIDQMDDPNLPRNGYWGAAQLFLARPGLGGDADYDRFELGVGGATSVGRHTGLGWMGGVTALGTELPFYARYQLGGLFNLSGYETGALTGQYGGMLGGAYMFQLFHAQGFVHQVAVGATVETGNVWESQAEVSLSDLRLAGSVFVGVDTMLGPIYLGYGLAETGNDAWYLYMGRFF